MTVTERILQLNEARGWTIYKLAKEANISPSTLTNMLHRGTKPSFETVERLCSAYGITMVQFFHMEEEMAYLTKDQSEHLALWMRLTDKQKQAVEMFINGLLSV